MTRRVRHFGIMTTQTPTIGFMLVLGLMLVGVGVIMLLAASGGLSTRMPTQVPPRAVAAAPLLLGVALVVADVMY